MPANSFRFVSPGVRTNEIDQTELPQVPGANGPLCIGRARKGPFMKPVTVSSKEELFEIFGTPISGMSGGGDVWRMGDVLAPTYGIYAALAHLQNGDKCTFVRLGGDEHPSRTDGSGEAGWNTDIDSYTEYSEGVVDGSDGGAYALFLANLTGQSYDTAAAADAGNGGPNDATFSGTMADGVYSVRLKIASEGTPDTFVYSINYGAWSAPATNITGAAQAVGTSGLSVAFVGTDNHTANDIFYVSSVTLLPMVHAATFYVNDGALALEGTALDGTSARGTASMIKSNGADFSFDMRVYGHDNDLSDVGAYDQKIRFNFNENSVKYIRKVFNTNPTSTNSDITAAADIKDLWVGETYRSAAYEMGDPGSGYTAGVLLKIETSSAAGSDHLFPMSFSRSGWVFAQDMSIDGPGDYNGGTPIAGNYDPETMQKLFRFHCLESGEWAQSNLKISIDNIKYSTSTSDPYGKFDVVIRMASDTDRRPVVIERFAQCDLNPASADYIGRRIGTRYITWDDIERKYKRFGEYENRSKYIRVELSSQVNQGTIDAAILPWGYYGETIFEDLAVAAGVVDFGADEWLKGADGTTNLLPFGTSVVVGEDINFYGADIDVDIAEARLRLRQLSSEEDTTLPKDVYWGVRTTKYGTTKFDSDYQDYVRCHSILQKDKSGDDTGMDYSYIFTLDDICYQVADPVAYTVEYLALYEKDSYKNGRSISSGYETTIANPPVDLDLDPSYKYLIDAGFARFTMPLFGGHDGRNVREKDMFRNSAMSGVTSAEDSVTNAPFYTLLKVADIVASKDKVKYDKLVLPGITNSIVQDKFTDMVQRRNDAIFLFDAEGIYTPAHENYDEEEDRVGSLQGVLDWAQDRDLNTAYAACWGNWFKIVDRWNSNGFVWVPGSVVGLGLIANAQKVGNVWASPAGFNRGNLSLGHAGLNVVDVLMDWDDEEGGDKDQLFVNHINPVLKYNEGIICMGDVTMLRTTSVLKSIGTRLLVNYIKDNVSFYAKRVLFDPNIMVTWNRFVSDVDPFLRDIQVGGGLADYKVVFDSSTTTQDLVDRNIMYAKIYLAPTEPGRFFGIDFILTRNGAEFAD